MRTCSPLPPPRASGDSSPASDDKPTALGSATVTNSSRSASTRQSARAPTKRSLVTATSTSARSGSAPGRSTISTGSRRSPSGPACPVATKPVAIPATVVSRISGKTLLVPVDSAQIGTSPQALATTRCVPSPPSTTIAATPSAHIRSTARWLSAAVEVIGMSSSWNAGNGAPILASRAVRPASWRRSALDNPSPAGIISVRCTPAAPSPARSRNTIPALSAFPNTDAPATSRRMSRPEAGLATIPTHASADTRKGYAAGGCAKVAAG